MKRKTYKKSRRKSRNRAARRKIHRPTTAKKLFAMPKRFQGQWNRAVQVPTEMRSHGLSLQQAARRLGISPKVAVDLAGPAFKKGAGGRYSVKPTDRLLRVLQIPSKKGIREVAVRDFDEASLVGEYWSAVEKFLTRGDTSALKKLRRKTVTNELGKRVRLLTNLEELKRQASAGVLHFESIYGRNA
jgi:hypothetical protein